MYQKLAPARTTPALAMTIMMTTTIAILCAAGRAVAQPSLHGAQYFEQDTGFIPDTSELGDRYGSVVAHGDFNCDGYQDLATGVPLEDLVGGLVDAGQVTVIFGSASGLDSTAAVFLSQSLGLLAGGPAGSGFHFGASLAAGNFDGNSSLGRPCDDLAIGVPGMSYQFGVDTVEGGAVIIVKTLNTGFFYATSRRLVTSNISGSAQDGDAFGSALAAGDFNDDGYDDLAIGAPYEDVGGAADAGRVRVVYGTEFGLSPADSPFLHSFSQASFGALVEAGDLFGSVLAAGDFDRAEGSHYDDLVVGVPDEDVGVVEDAGAIIAIYGSEAGLSATGSEIFTQNSVGIAVVDAKPFNLFGAALAVGDFDRDLADDVAVGSPGAKQKGSRGGFDVTYFDVGLVHVLYGEVGSGLTDLGDVGIRRSDWFGGFGTGDQCGFSLAAGDFNLDGLSDIAIASPGADQAGVNGAGIVEIMNECARPRSEKKGSRVGAKNVRGDGCASGGGALFGAGRPGPVALDRSRRWFHGLRLGGPPPSIGVTLDRPTGNELHPRHR